MLLFFGGASCKLVDLVKDGFGVVYGEGGFGFVGNLVEEEKFVCFGLVFECFDSESSLCKVVVELLLEDGVGCMFSEEGVKKLVFSVNLLEEIFLLLNELTSRR